MKTWFTSDTHFGHEGIIAYCERPFKDVAEMDAELIRRWNACVQPGDTIYHMGDFSFCGLIHTREIMAQLNGYKVLVHGNHDKHFFRKDGSFKDVGFDNTMLNGFIERDGKILEMSHYQYKGYDDLEGRDFSHVQLDDKGNWLLHGHVHRRWKINGRMINVGVDQWGFAPVSEEEIMGIVKPEKERK